MKILGVILSHVAKFQNVRGLTSPFTIATDNIKYLGVALFKQVKDMYDKNVKFLKKECEEYTCFLQYHTHTYTYTYTYTHTHTHTHTQKKHTHTLT